MLQQKFHIQKNKKQQLARGVSEEQAPSKRPTYGLVVDLHWKLLDSHRQLKNITFGYGRYILGASVQLFGRLLPRKDVRLFERIRVTSVAHLSDFLHLPLGGLVLDFSLAAVWDGVLEEGRGVVDGDVVAVQL